MQSHSEYFYRFKIAFNPSNLIWSSKIYERFDEKHSCNFLISTQFFRTLFEFSFGLSF